MEHICEECELILWKQIGDLVIGRCPICKKQIEMLICRNSSELCDYTKKMKKLMVTWSDEVPIVEQIVHLVQLFPQLKKIQMKELLAFARSKQPLEAGEYSLEACADLIKEGKKQNVVLFIADENAVEKGDE